jgi:ankyrin repeat protein
MRASRAGHENVVKLLIDMKADLNLERGGQTRLYMAVLSDRTAVVKMLVQAGAKGDFKHIRLTDELIRAACHQGGAIEEVLKRGAKINSTDPQGHTALMYAANLGLIDNVKLLLAKGANATLKTAYGATALSLAERDNSYEPAKRRRVVELLRAHLASKSSDR